MKTYGGPCCQCGNENEPYMVCGNIWEAVVLDDEKFLCLTCVETRLGRPLSLGDFTAAPINFGIFGFDCRTHCENNGYSVLWQAYNAPETLEVA